MVAPSHTQPSRETHDATDGTLSLASPEQSRPSTLFLKDGRLFDAQAVIEARKQLARLADWRGHASMEAISLARAIECTMDNLHECFHKDVQNANELVWNLETRYMGPQAEEISMKLLGDTAWQVDASVIDATLSLWLSSAPENKSGIKASARFSGHVIGDDEWLRSEGASKKSLRLIGDQTRSLARDLQWWVPRHLLNLTST